MIPKKLPPLNKNKEVPVNRQQFTKPAPGVKPPSKPEVKYNKDGTVHKPDLPRSQYDDTGRPIQTIPEIDDVDIKSQMNKYLNFSELD